MKSKMEIFTAVDEQVEKYVEEIRKKLHKGNDASLEIDNKQLASDL